MSNIFRGFSTKNRVRAPYTLVDRELIKRDLLNEFQTRRGERVMRPNYGSRIWDMLMNPNDPITQEQIREEATRICDKDPRVQVQSVNVFVLDHVIRVEINLSYVTFFDADTLYVEYVAETGEA